MISRELRRPVSPTLERAEPPVPTQGRRHRSGPGGPRWRQLLEARWRDRLHEVTQLSLEFHEAGTAVTQEPDSHRTLQQLMRRAVIARRGLADLDDALDRLAAGDYGRCERCAEAIPADSLVAVPEERYCPACG
jgi:RNA polymerase-binding transcription factor DksA